MTDQQRKRMRIAVLVGVVAAGIMIVTTPIRAITATVGAFTAVPMLPIRAVLYPAKICVTAAGAAARVYLTTRLHLDE